MPPAMMVGCGGRRFVESAPCAPFRMSQTFVSLRSIFIVFNLLGSSLAQRDPVRNFCHRFGHQTALVDQKLYIDGGLVNFNPISSNPSNYTNTWLSYQDLSVIGDGGMPQLYANLSKNATIPSVHGGILWGDDVNKRLYLFGGEYYQESPSAYSLYSYDILSNDWVFFGPPTQNIQSVSYGAGVSISARGEAYYFGGYLSNNSVPGWTGPRMATNGLIKYTMDSNSWSNNTGPSDGIRRAEGAMVYIPASDGGMLVYFGGVQQFDNGTVVGQSMTQILIYDILSSKWYSQNATGDIPLMRGRFCAGVSWPLDQSSYNIYIYGGTVTPPNQGPGFDDVYILSMPSFQWVKYYGKEQYPHNTLSCNVVNEGQMIIIGGIFPMDTNDCDANTQFGSHNLDLGEVTGNQWVLYQQNITTYTVPPEVVALIGGSASGGATKTKPSIGFDSPDIGVYMTRKASAMTRAPTRAIPSSSSGAGSGPVLSNGAIAGIAVGGAAVLIATIAGCCLFIRRHRRLNYHERHAPNETQWSPHSQATTAFPGSPGVQGLAHASPKPPVEMPVRETDIWYFPGGGVPSPNPSSATSGLKYESGIGTGTGTGTGVAHEPQTPGSAVTTTSDHNPYASSGYGPRELPTDPAAHKRWTPHLGELSPPHQTYYHR